MSSSIWTHSRRALVISLLLAIPLAARDSVAHAQDTDANGTAPSTALAPADSHDEDGQGRDGLTARSAQAGMFLPFTEAPRTDTQRAFAAALGGYDGARDSALLEGRGEVTVYGPIALRIGVLYSADPEKLRPTVGARVQALTQDDQGIDMSVGAFYKPEGFTEGEGEIEAVLAFGRRFGRIDLIGDLVYGQDPEGRERDGEVRLAELYMATPRLELGVDSRLRFDLGTEEDQLEAEGGAEYDLVAGPLASYTLGEIALSAEAGISVLGTPKTQVGLLAMLGVAGSL
ncbi:MAG TPA: hypothetical protein VK509_01455 [Polyangiales bacterium]|nr:hypothetical protein [Polyangiales bacterium]